MCGAIAQFQYQYQHEDNNYDRHNNLLNKR